MIAVMLIVGTVWLDMVVFWYLWAWFITPFGISQINMCHGFGLITLTQWIVREHKDIEIDEIPEKCLNEGFRSLIFWAVGYAAHSNM